MSIRRQTASRKTTGSTSYSTAGRSRSCISSTIRRVSVGNRWSRSHTIISDRAQSSAGRRDEPTRDLTAMWLWTLSTSAYYGNGPNKSEDEDSGEDEEDESANAKSKVGGFVLEYDAARKIAQGLGAHLEQLATLIEVKGGRARLLPVAERTRSLFQKGDAAEPIGLGKAKKKSAQLSLGFVEDLEEAEASGGWGDTGAPHKGETVLDRVHQ